jgi:hypothetical protein
MKKNFHPTKTMQRALAKVKHRTKLSVDKFWVIYSVETTYGTNSVISKLITFV